MTHRVQKLTGFALTGLAMLSVFAALPVISSTVTGGIEAAKLRVDSFEAYSASPIGTDRCTVSLQQSVALRDELVVSDLNPLNASRLQKTESKAMAKHCLTQAIYYEARSETPAGQKAVGEVVLNRVKSKHFPNSVCGVVYQGAERSTGCQFSFMCDGSLDGALNQKSWARSETVAEYLLTGMHRPITDRATHYHTTWVDPVWASSLKSTRQIGEHEFYRFKSRREVALTRNVAP